MMSWSSLINNLVFKSLLWVLPFVLFSASLAGANCSCEKVIEDACSKGGIQPGQYDTVANIGRAQSELNELYQNSAKFQEAAAAGQMHLQNRELVATTEKYLEATEINRKVSDSATRICIAAAESCMKQKGCERSAGKLQSLKSDFEKSGKATSQRLDRQAQEYLGALHQIRQRE